MALDKALNLLQSFNEQQFSEGVTPQMISDAEKELSVVFPKDYVEYLGALGAGYASSEEFIGLGDVKHLSVVEITNFLRACSTQRYFPFSYIPLKADGFGNYECIDTSISNFSKSKIVFWVHDANDDQKLVGDGFWDWFIGHLESVKDFDMSG